MSIIHTGTERKPQDLDHLGFLADERDRVIAMPSMHSISFDCLELYVFVTLSLSPLGCVVSIDSTVNLYSCSLTHGNM